MLRSTPTVYKSQVILKFGEGLVTTQLKHILEKKPIHHFDWDALPEYPARKLRHVDRQLDPRTGAALPNPARDNNIPMNYKNNNSENNNSSSSSTQYLVPDQRYHRVPVPHRYRDAYWWRERQARRIQCPTDWVSYKFTDPKLRERYSFMDLSFEEKFFFSVDDVVAHAKQERR
jgi:hypothetical protein